jgi:hypothetical protein
MAKDGIMNQAIIIWVAIRTKQEHNHPKTPILLGYFNPFSACNCTECMIVYSYMTNKNTNKTFNVCYLREYLDPEHQGEFFYSYETVYRNVPVKYKSKFNDKTKLKIVKFLDWNYKETATNYVNVSRVELIDQKQYYQSYKDVFGDVDEADEKMMWTDYGQQYDRQSLRKDFNPQLTKSKVKSYNDKRLH